MYPLADEEAPLELGSKKVLLLNGADDPMAPQASVNRLEDQLTTRHADLERRTRSGGHGVTADEVSAATTWLRAFS
jgi:phospholipase/carboxylesterase